MSSPTKRDSLGIKMRPNRKLFDMFYSFINYKLIQKRNPIKEFLFKTNKIISHLKDFNFALEF